MYKISIIIPIYNSKDAIHSCFKSLTTQTIGFENLEIIFVDDCSEDGTWEEILKLSSEYPNVFGYRTEQNSGFAGEPRNIGLRNSTAPYIMFLDSDDLYLNDACETLYNIIVEKNVDIVSGNYIITNGEDCYPNEEWNAKWLNIKWNNNLVEIKNINEEPDLLKLIPAVWSKIFKRNFLHEKKLFFEVGIPAQDLIFVTLALLESKGTIFIDKPVVNYMHLINQSPSVTTTKNKKMLSKFLEAYTTFYNILDKKYPKYVNLALRHLDFWTRQLISGNYSPTDTWDLLNMSHFLITKFNHSPNNFTNKNYKMLYKLIEEKKYPKAMDLINLLKLQQNEELITTKIKSKKVLSLFFGFDYDVGGLAKAVFNRSKLMASKGHDVSLINIDSCINYGPNIVENNYKNLNNIEKHFRELGYLSDNIEFINIFEYYREKNTLSEIKKINNVLNELSIITITDSYVIQKFEKKGNVKILNFFNRTDFTDDEIKLIIKLYEEPLSRKIKETSISEAFNKKLIKTENYVNDILNVVTIHGEKDIFYTEDGFIYLEILKKPFKYTIYDKISNSKIILNNVKEFLNHFVEEMCFKCSEKPFLINECSGEIPNFDNISSDLAYKIGWIHSNPYMEPYCCGSPLRNMSVLNNVNQLDALIALTETEKLDLTKEFGTDNIYSIPNMLNFEDNENKKIDKDFKKISIFARLSKEKNLGDAIKAFAIVHEKIPDATLNIYGRALRPSELEEQDKLYKLVHDLKLENVVLFKGHVTNVYEEMKNSLVTLCVSQFEGMSMIFLESMVNKTPLISYDLNYGPKDIINNGIDGIIVNQFDVESLAEKMIYLLENPNIAVKMGELAKTNILNNYTSNAVYKHIFNLFKEIYVNSELNNFEESISANISNMQIKYQKSVDEKDKLIKQNTQITAEKDKLIKQNTQITAEKDKLIKQNTQIIENTQKIDIEKDKLITQNKQIKLLMKYSTITLEYYKSKNNIKQKILFFLPYIYIILSHKEVILNLKLYRKLHNNEWFNIGYYINTNPDISNRKWCELLTPEVHYICHGYNEKRHPNPFYKNTLSKKELINLLQEYQ